AVGVTAEVRAQRAPSGVGRVVVQAEDRRQVRLRRAREVEPVFLGAGVGPLVGADAARAVGGDAGASEEPVGGHGAAVGPGVVLDERPQRGLFVAGYRALGLPGAPQLRRGRVRVVAVGQVDAHDIVWRARGELVALLGVDDVVGRGDEALQLAG